MKPACIWWALGYLEYKQDERRAAGTLVLCDSTHPCSWIRRIPDDGEKLSPESSFAQQYVSSFYWSLTTLMKTPWIGPDTVAEKVVATCAIGFGAIIYAQFLSTVQGSYNSYNKANSQKRDKVTSLTGYMDHYKIHGELRRKLLSHTNALASWLPPGLVNHQVLRQLPTQPRLHRQVLRGAGERSQIRQSRSARRRGGRTARSLAPSRAPACSSSRSMPSRSSCGSRTCAPTARSPQSPRTPSCSATNCRQRG